MRAYSRIDGSGIARGEVLHSNDIQRLPLCFFEFCVSIMWVGEVMFFTGVHDMSACFDATKCLIYHKFSIKPPGGLIYFKHSRGGFLKRGYL